MTVIPFPPRCPGGIVYQPVARGEILRAVFGGLIRASVAGAGLAVAVVMVAVVILGGV